MTWFCFFFGGGGGRASRNIITSTQQPTTDDNDCRSHIHTCIHTYLHVRPPAEEAAEEAPVLSEHEPEAHERRGDERRLVPPVLALGEGWLWVGGWGRGGLGVSGDVEMYVWRWISGWMDVHVYIYM